MPIGEIPWAWRLRVVQNLPPHETFLWSSRDMSEAKPYPFPRGSKEIIPPVFLMNMLSYEQFRPVFQLILENLRASPYTDLSSLYIIPFVNQKKKKKRQEMSGRSLVDWHTEKWIEIKDPVLDAQTLFCTCETAMCSRSLLIFCRVWRFLLLPSIKPAITLHLTSDANQAISKASQINWQCFHRQLKRPF